MFLKAGDWSHWCRNSLQMFSVLDQRAEPSSASTLSDCETKEKYQKVQLVQSGLGMKGFSYFDQCFFSASTTVSLNLLNPVKWTCCSNKNTFLDKGWDHSGTRTILSQMDPAPRPQDKNTAVFISGHAAYSWNQTFVYAK